jgi:hypothetical protein
MEKQKITSCELRLIVEDKFQNLTHQINNNHIIISVPMTNNDTTDAKYLNLFLRDIVQLSITETKYYDIEFPI